MPTLKFSITDAEHVAYKSAAALAYMPVTVWVRSNLGRIAREAAPSHTAKPKVDARTAAKYATLKANLAEQGRTVRDWYDQRERDRLATKHDHDHNAKMLALYEAETGHNEGE